MFGSVLPSYSHYSRHSYGLPASLCYLPAHGFPAHCYGYDGMNLRASAPLLYLPRVIALLSHFDKPDRLNLKTPDLKEPGDKAYLSQSAVNKSTESSASGTPVLDRIGKDLTQKAREGKIAPVVGVERERAIQSVIENLLCK